MKHLTTIALTLNLAIACAYAQQTGVNGQQIPIKMTFSGTGGASSTDLKQPNATTGEENLAGNGTLGSFIFQVVKASANGPQPNSTCSGSYFQTVAGGGLFRFQDGSLLYVALTQGGDCIDFVHLVAHCTWTFKISGGTGRFKSASGIVTLAETSLPVLFDALGAPVFFSETGEFTGTISGVAVGDDAPDGRR
ncbi:MAG TPA: hypothetical protein VMJ75_02230 [Candidatus Acidoferrales bacterium]|nr:hypothetical protein [Candidatus Acidoferrales bacterium]HXK04225.1 hypothetical protein [Verrucomicrobiae bacterium]